MTATDQIIEKIISDAETEATAIIAEAQEKAEKIIDDAKINAAETENSLKIKAEKNIERLLENSESGAALLVRNNILSTKRKEIEKTLNALCDYLVNLPADKYFSLILKIASDVSTRDIGIMYMNSRDVARISDDFKNNLEKLNIKLADTADDSLSGGFIIKYGDIELDENFSDIIEEKRQLLEDYISKELFKHLS